MKFIKKVAALCFCAALALSVMAVSASADTYDYTLTLVQTTTFANHDDDANQALEVSKNGPVAYDMYLEYTGSAASVNVSSFSFTIDDVKVGDAKVVTPTVNFYSGVYSESNTTTSAAYETPHSGNVTYSYTSGSTGASAQGNDFTLVPNEAENYKGEKIGTISFAINGAAEHHDLTVTLSNINLTTRVAGNYDSDAIALASVTEKWQVNPVYTMTLQSYTLDNTSKVIADTATTSYLYYDYAGNIYSTYENYTLSNTATLAVATDHTPHYAYSTGYTNSGWKLTTVPTNASSGWTQDAEQGAIGTIPASNDYTNVGDVTLTAQYTVIDYTFEFVYNGPTINGQTGTSGTYNVETIKDSDAQAAATTPYTPFTLPTVSWPGYNFMGWSATKKTNSTKQYSTLWPSYTDTDYDATQATTNANLINSDSVYLSLGAYGDVVLTAVWDEAGIFTAADYAFANTGDALILYAVPDDNYTATDTYKYTVGEDKIAMFIIPDARYNGEFATATNDKSTGNLDANKTYVIYAFIADSTTATKGNVTIDKSTVDAESQPATENITIEYDGDVVRNSPKNVNTADYGNVDALLAASGGTVRASDLTATQMRARLEADVAKAGAAAAYGSNGATVPTETKYGSIYDIKAIIALLS